MQRTGAYDAKTDSALEPAMREGLPLAPRDARLRAAATGAGGPLR